MPSHVAAPASGSVEVGGLHRADGPRAGRGGGGGVPPGGRGGGRPGREPSPRGGRSRRRVAAVATLLALALLLAALAVVRAGRDGGGSGQPEAALPDAPGTTTVDDAATGGAFSYTGAWSTSTGAAKHAGGDHWTAAPGAAAELRFSGRQVELRGAVAPHHGRAEVTVDSGPAVVVDLYAPRRAEDVVLFRSPLLEPGPHVVRLEVTGESSPAASGAVVALDRAVLGVDGLRTASEDVAPPVARAAPEAPAAAVAPRDTDSGAAEASRWAASGEASQRARALAAAALEGETPVFRREPGSVAVERDGDGLTKEDPDRFHRMISERRYGGPGTTVTISYRVRATEIRESTSSIVNGVKIGMKWPRGEDVTGYPDDDWRSVMGQEGRDDRGPGSYIFVTGVTERGYTELSRNGFGTAGYDFWAPAELGYEPGEWRDVVVTVEWLDEPRIRVRYWHDAEARGAPVYEAVDEESPFWSEPGYLWLRTDDADFEYDYVRVTETRL